MIVLDASALVAYLLDLEPGASAVASRVEEPFETLHAPQLLDLEVLQALRRYAAGEVSPERAGRAARALDDVRVARYPHMPLLHRIWELRANVSAYDAAYLALAEALDAPVVTLDRRMANVPGAQARIEAYG